jgi:hypothetical protein
LAGWGDDPKLDELRQLMFDEGWQAVRATIGSGTNAVDTVVVKKGDESREFTSDHIAFHRFVEGLREDDPTLPS